jgi:MYXO-CTERM domain-containing protein
MHGQALQPKEFIMKYSTPQRFAAMALALATAGAANAAQIDSDVNVIANAGPTLLITFDQFDNLLTAGPVELGANPGDVVFTSTPNTRLGADEQNLDQNGLWGVRGNPVDGLIDTPTGSGNFVSSAFVTRRGEFGFSFGFGVNAVGAFFNQFQVEGINNSMRLLAYDAMGNELESFVASVDTDPLGYNEGRFLGFQRASADIYGFGIADGTFVMDNLTISPVPEAEGYAMMLLGLAGLGLLARRRRA